MVYFEDNEVLIRDMIQSDAPIITNHELHPRNLVGCMDFKPWWPPRQQRRGEGTLLHFHVRICGCPAAWAFSWGPCGRKVWCFGTE